MSITRSPDLPLAGARVLITRVADDADALRGRLEALGASTLVLPTIEILPPVDCEPLDAALRNLDHYGWVAFTSRYAVDAVFERMAALSLPRVLPGGMRIAAVGPSTAARLAARGYRDVLAPAGENARAFGLGKAMRGQGVAGERILLPAAEMARPELRHMLEAAGAAVDTVVAYRTVAPRHPDRVILDALCRGEVDIVSVASPSALHNLAAMVGANALCQLEARLACIGPTTAAAIRAFDLEPVVGPTADVDGLVAAIVTAYGEPP